MSLCLSDNVDHSFFCSCGACPNDCSRFAKKADDFSPVVSRILWLSYYIDLELAAAVAFSKLFFENCAHCGADDSSRLT